MALDNQEISSDVAIIGAGVSGTYCAARLAELGQDVLVIEKARGSGGRLSSKRIILPDESSLTVDLGASDFKLIHDATKSSLDTYVGEDLCLAEVVPEGHERYVASPRNSMLTRKMLSGVNTVFSTRVTAIEPDEQGWKLSAEDKSQLPICIRSKQVIITAPPAQACELLPEGHKLKGQLSKIPMHPQWVVVLAFETLDSVSVFETITASIPEINYISVEGRKPGRDTGSRCAVVVYLSPDWTNERIELDKGQVLDHVLKLLESAKLDLSKVSATHVHRWLYSLPPSATILKSISEELPVDSFWGEDGMGICGDYLSHLPSEGVERACMSARSLLEKIKRSSVMIDSPNNVS